MEPMDPKARGPPAQGPPGERAQGLTLAEELRTHYFPELRPFTPFGDPQENRRDQEARDAAQAERAKKSWW